MLIRLSSDDAMELRKALETAYAEVVRELSSLAGCRCPSRGIGLYMRKRRVEHLLARIELTPVVQPAAPPARDESPLTIVA